MKYDVTVFQYVGELCRYLVNQPKVLNFVLHAEICTLYKTTVILIVKNCKNATVKPVKNVKFTGENCKRTLHLKFY